MATREQLRKWSQDMRDNPTPAESVLWVHLQKGRRGCIFQSQAVVCGYIADFLCVELKLIIEVDGLIHLRRRKRDKRRSTALAKAGYTIVRFQNHEVEENIKAVLKKLDTYLSKEITPRRSPLPSDVGSKFTQMRRLGLSVVDSLSIATRRRR